MSVQEVEFEPVREEVRKHMLPHMHQFVVPDLDTVDLHDVKSYQVQHVKGYPRFDTMKPADAELHRVSEMCQMGTLSRLRMTSVENDASGTTVLHTIGTITARLATPAEILFQALQLMPEWARPVCLLGRCQTIKGVKRDTKTDAPQRGKASRKKQSIAGRALHLISVICRIVQTLFATLAAEVRNGIALIHDQGWPLLGRVTRFCLETCGNVRKAVCAEMSENQSGPLAMFASGCKQLLQWVKSLVS